MSLPGSRREPGALACGTVLCTALVLLLAQPCTAGQQHNGGSWEDTVGILYQDIEGGMAAYLQRLHIDHPLAKSVYLGVFNASPVLPSMPLQPATVQDTAQAPATIANKAAMTLSNSRAIQTMKSSRKLHQEWLGGLQAMHTRRLLQTAQAPTTAEQFTAKNTNCKSVVCGGQCCDAFFTYGSGGNNTCTTPMDTCSAQGSCQYTSSNDTSTCSGMNIAIHPYPTDTQADDPSDQVGYTCPTGSDTECSYLNTFAADMSSCTTGSCMPTTSGGLSCVPLIQNTGNYGCVAAIQTYTVQPQLTSNTKAALSELLVNSSAAASAPGGR